MELQVPQPPTITLWQAPDCRPSKRARELLELTDVELVQRDLLASPPTADELRELLGWLGYGPRRLARTQEPAWAELGLAHADDEALIAALCRHPELIDRPIAAAAEHAEAVVGRPPELVLKLLIPKLPAGTTAEDLLRRAMQGRLPQ